ncbi:glycosyl hydrolase 115 family protein [Paenibacillus sp. S150]|uniref:glycosyl hydrolase 115 family protein n=1 Tax=Paenibacillus sp. S150 TaxID=2749826 RepID=UPI001C572D58|nr:glycosyl hydrolase 115 family protein [Paenibacillus sp. S150]MBW4084610.1 glycosyl hydrolase 115 family protein [Paenibacillus sp. S150]
MIPNRALDNTGAEAPGSPGEKEHYDSLPAKEFTLVNQGKAAKIYVDPKGRDYSGLRRVAESFASDIEMVTGAVPAILTQLEQPEGTVVIAGSIGSNAFIDALIAEGALDVSSIQGKRECYLIQAVARPAAGVDQALVIAGSDKLGTIYGIYSVSSFIGVSPWVYWADVVPERTPTLRIPESRLNTVSREPSVKYRGIFLNDDWPSLGSWVTHAFGDFNEDFYDKVFQLLLRLKGNYLWPAMWSAEFSLNGKSSPIANARLAEEYGIVMGTSHHEPLFRAGSEWQKVYRQYGTSSLWDFARNKRAITDFWEDGVKRNKEFRNLITLGMRGESDSALEGSDRENIELLKEIILTQKALLKKYNLEQAPQVLAVYKEVEKYWYGTDEVEGLKDWEALRDVTILLSDDNFGNLRKIPAAHQQNRSAGWGMYYHFDYHGGPFSYEWVNTVPLEKVWEQMSMAFDYGIREVWVVNVGDLKPMELPISYFMDLAYDFDAWGTGAENRTKEYTQRWVEQQFGPGLDKEAALGIAKLLSDYTRMNGRRKPEIVRPATFSLLHHHEAQRVLQQAVEIENAADALQALIPETHMDACYQLVYYPAVASANVVQMQIYAGLNSLYAERGSMLANTYAKLTTEAIEKDKRLELKYNTGISGAKWKGMMSSAHVGYVQWDAEGWKYPEVRYVSPAKGPRMIVDVEGTEQGYMSGTARLPVFTNLQQEAYNITISNGGEAGFEYQAERSADWILIKQRKGWIDTGVTIEVSVDWEKAAGASSGLITLSGAGGTVNIEAAVEWTDLQNVPPMTFIETHHAVSIEAEHALNRVSRAGVEWRIIENYGRTLSSVKMFPDGAAFASPGHAPYLEYRLLVRQDGEYTLTAYIAPTNRLSPGGGLKYAAGFDHEAPVVADALPAGYVGGDHDNEPWCRAVIDNIHTPATRHTLEKGLHTLRFYGLDAGLVLQKLVLSAVPLPYSYLGPEESFNTGQAGR